jgi:trans-2,3-dihydro-3-hydroxyanthranilate isomerase
LRFYIVDVFAESKYSGNQLAVFRDATKLSTREMQRIAQEMHFSETTFITSEEERNGGYDVRVFTPETELPFAGHPTLGTAYVLQKEIIHKPSTTIKLNMKVGQIPVTFTFRKGKVDLLWMKQKAPIFGREFEPKPVGKLLGLALSDLDLDLPIMEVSTGVPFIIVPLQSLKAVQNVQIERNNFLEFVRNIDAKSLLIFTRQTYHKENDLNVRVFVPTFGVPEDPATGSGNGCLAAYLVQYQYFEKNQIDVRVEQGYELDRKSLLYLKSTKTNKEIEVNVGGKVQFIAKGELLYNH